MKTGNGSDVRHQGMGAFFLLAVAAGILWIGLPKTARAVCIPSGSTVTCTGDESNGIASGIDFSTPPATTLSINTLSGPIQPVAGTEGIIFFNSLGSTVEVHNGTSRDKGVIVTQGGYATGIEARSQGAPAFYYARPSVTLNIPLGFGGAGGPVTVENYGDVTTDGQNSHGIDAENQTGGYPQAVINSLNAFDLGNISLSLETVAGSPSYIDCTVQGSGGGAFLLHPEGTFEFALDNTFDSLAIGEQALTQIAYQVRQTASGGATDLAQGVLEVSVSRADNGTLAWTATNHFAEYAGYDGYSIVSKETPLWPDLQGYVNGLKGDAGLATDNAAGLSVRNFGNIETKGASSIGILAETYGGAGGSGKNGGAWYTFGAVEPTSGKPGADGGGVEVLHDGGIETGGMESPGIVAYSRGGTGGRGGDGGEYYSGRQGGQGGKGGYITISGSGTIVTEMEGSSGILAVSEGGIGGAGGGDSTWANGGGGGYGGAAGSVVVDGAFSITTKGTESHGIWVKSIGGSGGVGGTGGYFGSGGSGGGASDGGNVSITNAGVDNTLGDYSYGIYGMSVGGFGGNGGSASGLFVSWGGSGRSAGKGGSVSITNSETGVVTTAGEWSHAIFGQSIGGGGGSGGRASAIVGLGGDSGSGGYGGAVSIVNDGRVETSGTGAKGISAQSIGGGGGDGGSSSGVVGIGGDGGAASNGGTISIVSSGSIRTSGNYAEAIYAQSIGGGGGSGGASGGVVSIGGSGKGGGNADNVTIENSGTIDTYGIRSRAIFAQSVGGGGGDGAGSGGLVSLGGQGSGAGNGAAVQVTNSGSITTREILSNAIQAQSIGGGGGSGAGSGGAVSLGGSGGGGGNGGEVIIHNLGSLVTLDNDSRGVYAQSIGGGGGDGAGSGGLVSLGGSGEGGGNGGDVTVTSDGSVETSGARSDALFAQSIGGGGGSGGGSGGIVSLGGGGDGGGGGGNVTMENGGFVHTSGISSRGIFAQSLGGGGGEGAGSGGLVSLGGSGEGGGNGGSVTATNANTGIIATDNISSHAIFAQSVGGGGGSGAGSGGGVSLGGSGGGGGNGGEVIVQNLGSLVTLGNDSRGVYAQSIGGGGGDGAGSGGLAVSLGGSGDGGGNGGDVTVTSDGFVETSGARSDALFAQSIGGGGGSGAGSGALTVSLGGSGAGGGDGGVVTVANSGTIHTSGEYSRGIFGQSVGGGGGEGAGSGALTVSLGGSGDGGGNGDNVTVTNAGIIATGGFASQAIFAQSVGGGGGSGAASGAVTVSLGGDGGGAGDGGAVRVTNDNQLLTAERYSSGIFAQSVGGGGGSGAGSGAWFASLGGEGSGGGSGGEVTVINSGLIATDNDWSHGIFAQSIGGGGGSGAGSGGMWVAIGGSGDGGGDGGNVGVTNSGEIRTLGSGARGIHAESIGGGGGSGAGSGALTISIGGDGGSAGDGGDVTVNNTGTIDTDGLNAHSIYAASVGGGGGSASLSGAMIFTLGGDGASGGDGGAVSVVTDNSLDTQGFGASGIFAQSVGGGGGNGGGTLNVAVGANFSIGIGLGGDGGAGGDGSSVTIDSGSGISTHGGNSHGILAQSIGGGGGSGGNSFVFSASAGIIPDVPIALNVAVSVGGDGGGGGDGSSVTIDSRGDIATAGFRSNGILAQSVGGGGGDGGNATSVTLQVNCDASGNVAIGGGGGDGGNGKAVDVVSAGAISTQGAHSVGILAQSVGGGGGAGGDSTSVNVDLSFPTSPEDLIPKPSMSFTLSMGGDGGGGGGGDNVTVRNSNTITTRGVFAAGILAQSVGGGGGAGGDARSFQIDLSANPIDYIPFLDLIEFKTQLVFGGNGGSGGSGNAVTVNSNSGISTDGAFAHGIFAQSVGGGGGAAGSALTFEFSTTDLPPDIPGLDEITGLTKLSMEMEGADGSAGNGGVVSVTNSGNIATRGDFAHGIVAQSVGGGGGLAGMLNPQGVTETTFGAGMRGILKQIEGVGVSFAGSVGGNGSGGAVTVAQTGDITTPGKYSHGIFAQSAGGLLSGGPVGVALDGEINAQGVGSSGILAQSVGGAGGGNISVDILGGSSVTGGSGEGAGIQFLDGANNVLTNRGTITTVLGAAGTAIGGTTGRETIHNYGMVTGSVDLGAGANLFHNREGGTFNSGAKVYLGNGDLLTNDGALSPGGNGNVRTTTLTGNLVQTGTGELLVDLDLKGSNADRLVLNGTADMAGRLTVNLLDPGWIPSGTNRYSILSGGENVADSGLALVFQPSAVIDYEMLFTGQELQLAATVDFSPKGLTGNQSAIGQAVNAIQGAGGTESFAPVAAELVRMTNPKDVAFAYDQMSPAIYANFTTVTQEVTRLYTQNLMKRVHSVRSAFKAVDGRSGHGDGGPLLLAYNGSDASLRQLADPGEAARRKTARYGGWFDFFTGTGNQDPVDGSNGYDFDAAGGTFGLDYLFSDRFLAGVSIGTSNASIDLGGNRGNGDIKSVFGSLYGSYFTRDMYLDMALSYGDQSYKSARNLVVGNLSGTVHSEHDGDLLSGYVEGGYNFQRQRFILQPYAGLRYTAVKEESFIETGAGPLDLHVQERETGSLVSEVGLRLHRVIPVENGNFIPELTLAWNHDFEIDDSMVTSSFAGAPSFGFSVNGQEAERNGGAIGVGLTFLSDVGISTSLQYRGDFRSGYRSHEILGELIRYEF